MRLLVVEDELSVARQLVRLLERLLEGSHFHIESRTTFAEAREFLAQKSIDLLFLDLNLHGRDGFDLLGEAVAASFETIVVSANTDRALAAFDYGVVDFVSKPFTQSRLQKALERFHQRLAGVSARPAQTLAVRGSGRIDLVSVDKVTAIHGAGNYAEIETHDGRRFYHDKSLDRLEAILPERFVRIHRSHLVDWNQAVRIECHSGSRYQLVLANGRQLNVGRGRVAELKKLFL